MNRIQELRLGGAYQHRSKNRKGSRSWQKLHNKEESPAVNTGTISYTYIVSSLVLTIGSTLSAP